MARQTEKCTIKVTNKYVHNPEAAERGRELWASYLAEHLARRLAEEARARRQDQL